MAHVCHAHLCHLCQHSTSASKTPVLRARCLQIKREQYKQHKRLLGHREKDTLAKLGKFAASLRAGTGAGNGAGSSAAAGKAAAQQEQPGGQQEEEKKAAAGKAQTNA